MVLQWWPPVAGMVDLCSLSPIGCPCLASYMHPGRVYMSCGLRNHRWLLGLHLGLQVGLRLGRIGYANGGVPGGYAHITCSLCKWRSHDHHQAPSSCNLSIRERNCCDDEVSYGYCDGVVCALSTASSEEVMVWH